MLIVGAKRSGKSTLATSIASRFDRVFVVGERLADRLPNSTVCESEAAVERAIRAGASRITYVPGRDEMPGLPEVLDRLLVLIFMTRAAWCFLFHGIGDFADERTFPPAFGELVRKGAGDSHHVVIVCYQRVFGLPRILTNNLDVMVIFALNDPDDVARAAAIMGAEVKAAPLVLPFRRDFYMRTADGGLLYVDQVAGTARVLRGRPIVA